MANLVKTPWAEKTVGGGVVRGMGLHIKAPDRAHRGGQKNAHPTKRGKMADPRDLKECVGRGPSNSVEEQQKGEGASFGPFETK